MLKKRFLNIFAQPILATCVISLGQYLYNPDSSLWLNITIIFIIFLIYALKEKKEEEEKEAEIEEIKKTKEAEIEEIKKIKELNDKKHESLMSLVEISNNIPKGDTEITSVSKFLKQSEEEALKQGDKVTVLTNDLSNYDLLPKTLDLIAGNINESVVYEYYLPLDHEAQLREQVHKLANAILERTNSSSVLNLKIYTVDLALIYSFAMVEKQSKKQAYWYLSMETNSNDANLLIVELKGTQKVKLEQVLATVIGKEVPIKDILF